MLSAESDAAADGITFQVTSGWRSTRYQQWLLDDAIDLYASEEVARQFVATPERSSHVTGHAVDIGPVDAQFWLIEHGARYGICQTYANERWHFELVDESGRNVPDDEVGCLGLRHPELHRPHPAGRRYIVSIAEPDGGSARRRSS